MWHAYQKTVLVTDLDHGDNGSNRVKNYSRDWPINRDVLNFNNIPYFDGTSYKEDFIDLILNPGDYFNYTKIPE